jgi:hypothetical protein
MARYRRSAAFSHLSYRHARDADSRWPADSVSPPHCRYAIIMMERSSCQIEHSRPFTRQPGHDASSISRLASLACARGRHDSNSEIVAIDPAAPGFFPPTRHRNCASIGSVNQRLGNWLREMHPRSGSWPRASQDRTAFACPRAFMLFDGQLLADRTAAVFATHATAGLCGLACGRRRRSRRLAQQHVERLVGFLGEIDIKLAKFARLGNKVLI